MNIEWLGQSGYILRTAKATLAIDPYLSDAVERVAGRPRLFPSPIAPEQLCVDAVVCTHDHLDHLDPDAVVRMKAGMRFITTEGGAAHLHALGIAHVDVLHEGESTAVGDLQVTAVFAKHTVEAFGLLVRGDGLTLYFSGDTLFDERLYAVAQKKPDAMLVCINGKLGNMNVDEAVQVARYIGAPLNIPNHYGMFASNTEDPAKFTGRIPGAVEMTVGVPYRIVRDPDGVRLERG